MSSWLKTTGVTAALVAGVSALVPSAAWGQQVRERDIKVTGPRGNTLQRQLRSEVTPNGISRSTTVSRPGGTFTREVQAVRPPAFPGGRPPMPGPGRPPGFGPGPGPMMRGWGPPPLRPVIVNNGGISGAEAFGIGALGAAAGAGAGFLLGRATAPPPPPVVVGAPVDMAAPVIATPVPPPVVVASPAVVASPPVVYQPAPPAPPDEVAEAMGRLASWHASSRKQAAYVLGRLGDPSAVPSLVDTLKNDKNKDVRIAAATAIGQIGDPSSAIFLQRSSTYDKTEEVRDAARIALSRMPREVPLQAQAAPFASRPVQQTQPAPAASSSPTDLQPLPEPEVVPPPPVPVRPSSGVRRS